MESQMKRPLFSGFLVAALFLALAPTAFGQSVKITQTSVEGAPAPWVSLISPVT
jgi:hypothetical protein